jgi:succinate dehydrogenase/fumarate reductase flavoprotein subunit
VVVLLEHIVKTDVLVIGGGLAGFFAALKAREQGVEVILVDKSYVGKSGSTPWADTYAAFKPEWGHKLAAWMDHIIIGGEYVNNREWAEIIFKESYARYQDLVSWGVEFEKEDGRLQRYDGTRLLLTPTACEVLITSRRKKALVLRNQAMKRGVKIMDRIMVTDILNQDGRIVGAIGFSIDSGDLYTFESKATIISAGAAGFRPHGWPISNLTGDGMAIAYRVGAELIGNEFVDTHTMRTDYPASRSMGRPAIYSARQPKKETMRFMNAEGDVLTTYPPGRARSYTLNIEFEAHAGRAPLYVGLDVPTAVQAEAEGRISPEQAAERRIQVVGCVAGGLAIHTTEGIYPINTKCATSLPGLYAAGDSLGTMQVGSVYSAIGVALAGASVTGTRAGLSAAEYALQTKKLIIIGEELDRLKKTVYAPLERKGGFSPRWVTQILQNITRPYFIFYIKHEKRLQAALTLVEFLRDHLTPKLTAEDPHELRLAHETKNMVLNAEMKLRSSLFRTESRGCHYREDYPRRDDPTWLAWVKLKKENGKMKLWKEPIPEEWWPDLSKPYEERYPVRFPGE